MVKDLTLALPATLPVFVIVVAFALLLWKTLNRTTPFDDDTELFVKNNYSYLLQRVGLVAAQIIAMSVVITDFDVNHPWWSALWLAMEATWVFVALLAARLVVDQVLLPKINNVKLMLEGNLAIGIVEAGFYVGLGFILKGSLSGTAETLFLSVASTVVFAGLGLAFMIGVFWLHELVTPYHLRERLQQGHVSAALELAGVLVAVGLAVSVGVAGDFSDWGGDMVAFLTVASISVIMVYLMRWAVDKAILTHHTIKSIQDENQIAPAALLCAMLILSGWVVSLVMAYVV